MAMKDCEQTVMFDRYDGGIDNLKTARRFKNAFRVFVGAIQSSRVEPSDEIHRFSPCSRKVVESCDGRRPKRHQQLVLLHIQQRAT